MFPVFGVGLKITTACKDVMELFLLSKYLSVFSASKCLDSWWDVSLSGLFKIR
jgi:hypothetical protein